LEDHGRETGQFMAADAPYINNHNAKFAYITKDSGERQQFESGMQRDTTVGKLLFHLVRFGPMFMRWVGLLTRGAVKYDENNWMKANGPAELKRFIESADRHFAIWATYRLTGVNIEDPEKPTRLPLTEDHAAAVFFNINGAEYVVERSGIQALTGTAQVAEKKPAVTPKNDVNRIIRELQEQMYHKDQQEQAKQQALRNAMLNHRDEGTLMTGEGEDAKLDGSFDRTIGRERY